MQTPRARPARAGRFLVAACLVLGAIPSAGSAQACGVAGGGEVAAAGGVTYFDLGEGQTGPNVGLDVATRFGATAVEGRAGYRMVLLDPGPDPHLVRVELAVPLPLPAIAGAVVCATGHGGGSVLSSDEGTISVLAGGAGIRLARPVGDVTPYVEIRGLVGRSAGDLAGIDVAADAWAVGGAAGLHARIGGLVMRATGSWDGFQSGLGLPPYPRFAGGLSIGVPF